MTTNEAFAKLISKRGWYMALGVGDNTANVWAKRFRDGKLDTDKIEEVLALAGYMVLMEKQWAEPGAERAAEPTSDLQGLIDLPDDYWSSFPPWQKLHSHMWAPGTEYMDQMRDYDVYRKKLAVLEAGKLSQV